MPTIAYHGKLGPHVSQIGPREKLSFGCLDSPVPFGSTFYRRARQRGKIVELCQSEYGNHVVTCMLDFGPPHHRQAIIDALSPTASRLRDQQVVFECARNKHAAYVIDHILVNCRETNGRILDFLLENICELVRSTTGVLYASHVAIKVLWCAGAHVKCPLAGTELCMCTPKAHYALAVNNLKLALQAPGAFDSTH